MNRRGTGANGAAEHLPGVQLERDPRIGQPKQCILAETLLLFICGILDVPEIYIPAFHLYLHLCYLLIGYNLPLMENLVSSGPWLPPD